MNIPLIATTTIAGIAIINWMKWKATAKTLISIVKEKGYAPTDSELKAHSAKVVKGLFKGLVRR